MAFQEMSNLDYFFLLKELRAELVGARLNNFYELVPGFFRLKLSTKQGERNLAIELGKRMNLTKYLQEAPKQPTAFAKFLRARLNNALLAGIKQINLDRVVCFEFQTTKMETEKLFLIAEMLGSGNLIVCDSGNKIIGAYRKQEFAARKIAVGEKYAPPPIEKKNAGELRPADFAGFASEEKIVSALARAVNLPPVYLEEACARARIAPTTRACDLSKEAARMITDECARLLEEKLAPRIYLKNGEPMVVAPFALKKAGGAEFKEFASFSQALDEYCLAASIGKKIVEKNIVFEKQLSKLRFLLEQQKQVFEKRGASAAEKQAAGDWIKANAGLLEELIKLVREKRGAAVNAASRKLKKGLRASALFLEKNELVVDVDTGGSSKEITEAEK